MIEKCTTADFEHISEIINDAASAYKGIIPADCWHEPYMPKDELRTQINQGVEFWCYKEGEKIMGVMGVQDKGDVTLIRHAYVRTIYRNKGIGGKLLAHLIELTSKPVLIGTWSDAKWAIDFYKKNGFSLLPEAEKNKLLARYWIIPQRQVETSVVLAKAGWTNKAETHFRKLERMYLSAPVNNTLYKGITINISTERSELGLKIESKFFHAAGAIHGSVYFKMLDDAAFFAVNSIVPDVFVYTVSFTIQLLRPASGGTIKSIGELKFKSTNLFIADSTLFDENNKVLGRGTGNFMKSKIELNEKIGYK